MFDQSANPRQLKLLLEIASASNRSQTTEELTARVLDALAAWTPFETAFFMLVQADLRRVTLAQPRGVSPALERDLRDIEMPPEFYGEVESAEGYLNLAPLTNCVLKRLSAHGLPAPVTVPLHADLRGMGLLVLCQPAVGSQAPDGAFSAGAASGLTPLEGEVLDAVGNQIGIALWRAQLERRLRESEERFRTFVTESRDGFWQSDAQGSTVFVNDAALDIFGYTRQEILGQFPIGSSADSPQTIERITRELYDKGYIVNQLLHARAKDGTVKDISATVRLVRDPEGNVSGMQTIFRDVSEQARVEDELRRRTRELRVLNQLAHRLNRPENTRAALNNSLMLVSTLVGIETALVLLLNPEHTQLTLAASRNFPPDLVQLYSQRPIDPAVLEPGYEPEQASSYLESLLAGQTTVALGDVRGVEGRDTRSMQAAGYLAGIAAPIKHGGEILGLFLGGSGAARDFSDHDRELVEGIADQLGLAIHNQRSFLRLSQQISDLQAIARVGELIQQTAELETALPAIAQVIRHALGAAYVTFLLLRDEKLERSAASDNREAGDRFDIKPYIRRILNTLEPAPVNDIADPHVDPQQREDMRTLEMRAAFAAPLITRREPSGILFVDHAAPHAWTAEERRLILTFAQQISAALDSHRLLHNTRAQVAELEALARVGQTIASTYSPEEALQVAALEIAGILRADYVSFHLLQDEKLYLVAESLPTDAPTELPVQPEHMQQLIARQATRVRHRDLDDISDAYSLYLQERGLVAALDVPLIARGHALGVLSVAYRQLHEWTDEQERLATTFAQQIAATLETAQLLSESQQQVKEFGALADVAHRIALSERPEEVLPFAAERLAGILNADYVAFNLVEGESMRIVTESRSRWAGRLFPIRAHHHLILDGRQTVIVNDREQEEMSPDQRDVLRLLEFQADVGVPLFARGIVFGILFVSQRAVRHWTQRQVRLIETFANQVSAVFAINQLLREKQARVRELSFLYELSELAAWLGSEPDLIQYVAPELKQMLGADGVWVNLIEDRHVGPAQGVGVPEGIAVPLPLNHWRQDLLKQREPFIVDPAHPLEPDSDIRRRLDEFGAHSAVIAPLFTSLDPQGFLTIGYRVPHTVTAAEQGLIKTVSSQLAVGLNNIRYANFQRRRAEKLGELNRVVQTGSLIRDPQALQRFAVEQACTLLDADAASIRLIEDGMLTTGWRVGYADESASQHLIKIDALLRETLAEPQPFAVRNLEEHAGIPASYRARQRKQGFVALLMAPMWLEGSATGMLTVFKKQPYDWSSTEQQFAQTVANAFALLLSNARLFDETENARRELDVTLDSVFSGVLTTDVEGRVLAWNRAAENITGFKAAEMVGNSWVSQGPRVGTDRRDDGLAVEAMQTNSVEFSFSVRRFITAEGREIELREVASPLHSARGEVKGAVIAFWERSHEKQAEVAKLDLIAEKGHTLSHKLDLVVLSAEALLDTHFPAKERRVFLKVLGKAVGELRQLQEEMTVLEKDKFKDELDHESVDLAVILKDYRLGLKAKRDPRRVRLVGKLPLVLGDRARLATVLNILLDNAVAYSPPRSTVRIVSRVDDHQLELEIQNPGEPIPPELVRALGQPGVRGRTGVPGSGLGLGIARTKLHELGTELRITSAAGEGTRVSFSLPLFVKGGSDEQDR